MRTWYFQTFVICSSEQHIIKAIPMVCDPVEVGALPINDQVWGMPPGIARDRGYCVEVIQSDELPADLVESGNSGMGTLRKNRGRSMPNNAGVELGS